MFSKFQSELGLLRISRFYLLFSLGLCLGLGCLAGSERIWAAPQNLHQKSTDLKSKSRSFSLTDSFSHWTAKKVLPVDLFFPELGFPNLGNTCFANAVFKLLAAHSEILDWTSESNPFSHSFDDAERKALKDSIHHLFSAYLWSQRQYSVSLTQRFSNLKGNPRFNHGLTLNFSGYLRNVFDRLEDYLQKSIQNEVQPFWPQGQIGLEQSDAAEFLMGMLDVLEYNRFFPTFREGNQLQFRSGNTRSSGLGNPTSQIFLGISALGIHSVEDALQASFRPGSVAEIQDELTGQMGNGHITHFLTGDLENLPRHLFVVLNRFEISKGGVIHKINRKIEISENLNVKFYDQNQLDSRISKPVTRKYFPKAVIVHLGNHMGMGHYLTYARRNHSHDWYLHDDSSVRWISPKNIEAARHQMETGGYVILYEAI